MLRELRCKELIKDKLEFNSGLNAVIGPNDGTNSIGKSSVLMLIDFALSGDDFTTFCSDVIEHIGIITIEMDFVFEKEKFSFSRSTNDPKVVKFLYEPETPEKSIDEYRNFLKKYYGFPENSISFRSAVNPFFRIWGKDNYNPNKPLNSFPSEPYSNIKPNILKLFSLYDTVKELEKEKNTTEKKKKTLKGAFDEGYLVSLTKRDVTKKENKLLEVQSEIQIIKSSIEAYSLNAKQIVNNENLKLKSKKDNLTNSLFHTQNRLNRINDNLQYGTTANKKHFEKLKLYFPEVNDLKLSKIDQFHSGITKILKSELRDEKDLLEESVKMLETAISSTDKELVKSLGMLDKPSGLVDKMLELSIEEKSLHDQLKYREIKETVDKKVTELSGQITQQIVDSLKYITETLNSTMSIYINKFYEGKPVSPEIKLSETNYMFNHNDDSGTGKAYANMVAMDMSLLKETYLPILIHDLIVFSNIEDHAIEEIINEYSSTKKQVFIAIDKLSRFDTKIQKLVNSHEFLSLDSTNLAFRKSWKTRT